MERTEEERPSLNMDPTFPVDLHPATFEYSRHDSADGRRNGENTMGNIILKVIAAAFAVVILLPAFLYTGHWMLRYEEAHE